MNIRNRENNNSERTYDSFYQVCHAVETVFEDEWRDADEYAKSRRLEREKKALMGYEAEAAFYKARIKAIIDEKRYGQAVPPPWYRSLEDGVFHEIYGLAGLAPWAYDEDEKYRESSSAKIIGDRMYCLIDGKSQLQPQKISLERREKLKRTLLLASPRERMENGFHEIYLHNGIRITIFSGERTKKGEDIMVFRKYVLREHSFESLVKLKTIPAEAVSLFRTMIRAGFNVLFAGAVRSGKTHFMQVWQSMEDPSFEGLAIATDPETPWHTLMPDAPIMQLIADGSDLENIGKSILRGDNDYVLIEEMRDACAYRIALEITSTGTRRSKATIHDNSAVNIPYKMASKICEKYGGNLQSTVAQVFQNFDFVFEFAQLPENRAVKKLKGISELRYDKERDMVSVHEICRYDFEKECWQWKNDVSLMWEGLNGNELMEAEKMKGILNELECRNPIKTNSVIYPRYYKYEESEKYK